MAHQCSICHLGLIRAYYGLLWLKGNNWGSLGLLAINEFNEDQRAHWRSPNGILFYECLDSESVSQSSDSDGSTNNTMDALNIVPIFFMLKVTHLFNLLLLIWHSPVMPL